ncbi:MAG: S8 family serine peptidase [Roseovarius sp.]|nr:S8 family serine peptidase [Roseovarius sp.]
MADATGLPLLKRIMAQTHADTRSLYAPERLRFALELAQNGKSASDFLPTLRSRLETITGSHNFTLEPLFEDQSGAENLFFVFAPDGLDRTLPDEMLFAIAHDLRRELDLVSCEPDTGAQVFSDPDPDPPTTTEGAVLDATCWVHGAPPEPKDWALAKTNVPAAWALAPGKGEGIIVAQPDTGIAEHQELAQTHFDFTRSLNLIEGGKQPTDPLTSAMSNPGHGTGTASVLASAGSGTISGSAPGATIVPIRCINDVKIFNAIPVARAVDHAVSVGAHVITMSLGGLWSSPLRAAIRRAIAADVIVLSAAGNCVGLVVWPARYPEMIAVGGTDVDDRKWKGSSTGSSVDFSAPAQHVWKAVRSDTVSQTNAIAPGQGTSFATALCAGIAALWLEHHGRSAVIAKARTRGVSVQALFAAAVRQTAHRPAGFPSGLGAGVIDAEALVALPLPQIGTSQIETASPDAADPSGGLSDALGALFGPGAPDPAFDWAAHGAELSALLVADIRAGRGREDAATEARAFRQSSSALTEAAASSRDSRIAHLVLRGRPAAPSIMIRSSVSPERLGRLLSGFGAAAQPGLAPEAAASVSPEQGRTALDGPGRARALRSLERRLESSADAAGETLIEESDRALAELHTHGTVAKLNEINAIRLEALVSLTERPAIPVVTRQTPDGDTVQTVDVNDPEFGRFAGMAAIALPALEQGALASVGRIDGDGIHLGTGWMVGPGLVMTNRHVLEEFAAPLPRLDDPESWQIYRDTWINFSPQADDLKQNFKITGVAFAGAQQIRTYPVSFAKLDLALLTVATNNDAGGALPAPVAIAANAPSQAQSLFALGYPAPPHYIPRDEDGQMRQDVIERLRTIFGLQYRRKYFSPGSMMAQPHQWVFDHDATTLGGNSGSLVGTLSDEVAAVGLHFAGDWLRANHAHDLIAVLAARPGLVGLLP